MDTDDDSRLTGDFEEAFRAKSRRRHRRARRSNLLRALALALALIGAIAAGLWWAQLALE
ncbi:hypothetical protein HMF7854_05090 [Sphingomonas ginkgonis]|uniref:Uncharacterized protein n=1 Tax=Sphingomonas ginkgonis TaxID=2315330 RepID=A0A429V8L5_9SPHN|nr:hypothetical protein [Sphingomonas ginkgonis]RST30268.1 hypothetical protein HMF7854_05090 [Sphingomonas ginkgonis]